MADGSMFDIQQEVWDNLRAEHANLRELMRRGIFTDAATGKQYFSGYQYQTLYDWDQYFEAISQLYLGWDGKYISNGIEIFLDHQRADGFIARVVPVEDELHAKEHVKPFLCQSAVLLRQAGKGDAWLTPTYFVKLQKYLDYWLAAMDSTGVGLSEWLSAPHTGMDNQHERAGYWGDRMCAGVDLNAFLVRECRAMAQLAEWRNETKTAESYREKAEQRARTMRELMWDETDGLFYDLNVGALRAWQNQDPDWDKQASLAAAAEWAALNQRLAQDLQQAKANGAAPLMRIKYAGIFAALWAGVATAAQARQMVFNHLMNPDEFWSPYPVAVLAKSERWYLPTQLPGDLGCSWRANTWLPTNYYIFQALRNYGYTELATLLVNATTRLMKRTGNREYFCSETGAGRGLEPFWGWSLLGWFMPLEDKYGLDPTALT